jgi:hypothetical protein
LQRGRWPRGALQWVVEAPYESELWRSAMAARVTLNLDGVINKGWLKQWVGRRKSGENTLAVGGRASLTLYPKECLKGGETCGARGDSVGNGQV